MIHIDHAPMRPEGPPAPVMQEPFYQNGPPPTPDYLKEYS